MASTFQDRDPNAIEVAGIQGKPDSFEDTRCDGREMAGAVWLKAGVRRYTYCSGHNVADEPESKSEVPRPDDHQHSTIRQLSRFEVLDPDELEAGAPDRIPEENDEYQASRPEDKRAKEQRSNPDLSEGPLDVEP